MKPRYLVIMAALMTGLLGSAAYAEEDPVGVPMGEVQNGDPDAGQHYNSGDATNAAGTTNALGDAAVSEINSNTAASEFDGSNPDQATEPSGTNIGTVVEPNGD
jgi:hypothetical protein